MDQPNRGFWSHLRPAYVSRPAARITYTFCLGGLAFLSFIILAGTGVLLLFHYLPGPSGSFASVTEITSVVPFGRLFRSIHFWAGQAMVILVFLHMGRVFYTGSYRPPRELNWIIGVGLLVLTVALDFGGYLLRGNQETLSASAVAANLVLSIPGPGPALARIFFGETGPGIGVSLNAYVWHSFGLPLGLGLLAAWHFWKIRRDGFSRPL